MSAPTSQNNQLNQARLTKFYEAVVNGTKHVKDKRNANQFLQAMCSQPDPPSCLVKLKASPKGLTTLQDCMRMDLSLGFLNGQGAAVIEYLQDPSLKSIAGGDFLRPITQLLVEPPIFWDELVKAFKSKTLGIEGERSFAWLLWELISLPHSQGEPYYPLARDSSVEARLVSSADDMIRTVGHRIQNFLTTLSSSSQYDINGPGGRHDNDFADFRKISILPTELELKSTDEPFLRVASEIDDPEHAGNRVAVHLDNQYRLLREDMICEMREELQVARNNKRKGRHRGLVITGLRPVGTFCGTQTRREPVGLKLQLLHDLPELKKVGDAARRNYFKQKYNIFRHQNQMCLLVDGQAVGFPTISRDVDLLAMKPPIVVLQFAGKEMTENVLIRLKTMKNGAQLVQLDTAVFSFEPILRRLQMKKELTLKEELLDWAPGNVLEGPPSAPEIKKFVEMLEARPLRELKDVLKTAKSIKLNTAQSASLLMGLRQRVSLIQGPPGTGKSFIGAMIAKILYEHTDQKILVVCYTNHALDQFLEDLLNIGIPTADMVRLGGKSTAQTKPLTLFEQKYTHRYNPDHRKTIDAMKVRASQLSDSVDKSVAKFQAAKIAPSDLMEHLEFEDDGNFYDAFTVPTNNDGMIQVGKNGKSVDSFYLIRQWLDGKDAGIFNKRVQKQHKSVWAMSKDERAGTEERWKEGLLREMAEETVQQMMAYNEAQSELDRKFSEKNTEIIKSKRIIGCTTTAAAKYAHDIQAALPGVLLVEEAGEILESHILTALGENTKQLILIGDHKQLRPKYNNYALSVEKGDGFDFNRSLFERLVLKGYPHQTLTEQHRMRPEISELVRKLTYPDLMDAPKTQNRPDIRGFCDNVVFLNHTKPEDENTRLVGSDTNGFGSSKQNRYEADMVLRCVRYLGQQGYGTDDLVVLTPYLAQLSLLREVLSTENDPILNDLDSAELVRAGLVAAASARLTRKPIRLCTIDNYQGEECDIVIATLTRSNAANNIGFMSQPERLNVLLSRARNGLILIGNSETFAHSKTGGQLWTKLFGMLKDGGHVYDGFPIRCQRHPDQTAVIMTKEAFDEYSPDGGCKEPCGVKLSCKVHSCAQRCHQVSDHSKIKCTAVITKTCSKGHVQSDICQNSGLTICRTCDWEEQQNERRKQREFAVEQRRAQEKQKHQREMALLDDKIQKERERIKDEQDRVESERALDQKRKDVEDARQMAQRRTRAQTPPQVPQATASSSSGFLSGGFFSTVATAIGKPQTSAPPAAVSPPPDPTPKLSPTEEEWIRQKTVEGAANEHLDKLMNMIGLEEVKSQVLKIKSKIDTTIRQGTDLDDERFGVILQGNPGTGKTTVARLYSQFLASVQLIPGNAFEETTGAALANDGVKKAKETVEKVLAAGGGAIFIDEAYQLTSGNNFGGGAVLDYLLAEIENTTGKIVFMFAGYNKEMEKFLQHNPGLTSRLPYSLQFEDYEDRDLLKILRQQIEKKYKGRMEVEDGLDGLYMRIVARRLGCGRGTNGFGNARAVLNMFARIKERQSDRLTKERRKGIRPDDFYLTKEDLIGPRPNSAITRSKDWKALQGLIGLDSVKDAVKNMFNLLDTNYERELREKVPMKVALNRVLIGSPGTGKTTVAKMYGKILADLGLLSSGEVVMKNPSDFIGSVVGGSEENTKNILAATVGKVLIIDEAYMLYSSSGDIYRTAVIDTLVAEVQNVPGEDRCVLLLGYEDEMKEMFDNVNPGLSRRFAISDAFKFQDFTQPKLMQVLDLKLKQQDLEATDAAKAVASEVLERARRRPNFGNGGEVENLISQAKQRYQKRQSGLPMDQRQVDAVFEAVDIDPDFDRGKTAADDVPQLFEGMIGCEAIVNTLQGYSRIAANLKAKGIDPLEGIPTNFVFKGPPGTGKTTVAQKMGTYFYNMGFLASTEIIESSASEMIGQYVGQTGPKTAKLLERALGKVLFIDEAYRLADGAGSFASEAVNELVDCLTKPKYQKKLVVILAGYEHDMNSLMKVNPGLSSRFPEEIFFKNLAPEECLRIIYEDVIKKQICADELLDPTSPHRPKILASLDAFSKLTDWGNGRDCKTIAKKLVGIVYNSTANALSLSAETAAQTIAQMLKDRQARDSKVKPATLETFDSPLFQPAPTSARPPPTPPRTSTVTATKQAHAPPPQKILTPDATEDEDSGHEEHAIRDAGVSNAIWAQLQRDRLAAEAADSQFNNALESFKQTVISAYTQEQQIIDHIEMLEKEKAKSLDQERREQILREQEQERIRELTMRAERERLQRECERVEKEARERRRKEEAVQRKLREVGNCQMGYRWIKQGNGYRCSAGGHFVMNAQLGL